MPSDPSPATDHFASFEAEVASDRRLSAEQRRLMGLSARRVRRAFLGSPELMQMYVVNVLRAQAEVMGLGTAKRLMALDLFNRTFDGANRIAHRFGRGEAEVPARSRSRSALWAGPRGSSALWDRVPRNSGAKQRDDEDDQDREPEAGAVGPDEVNDESADGGAGGQEP
jgi:hypothetical protein